MESSESSHCKNIKYHQSSLFLADDKDRKAYTNSVALLNGICDSEFLFGLYLLKVILSNINSLSKYLQAKNMGVITARRNTNLTIKTHTHCQDESNFELLWTTTQNLVGKIKEEVKGTRFSVNKARTPRKQPSLRIQAIAGEKSEPVSQQTLKLYYCVNTYFLSLDNMITDLTAGSEEDDQDILCTLEDIVLIHFPSGKSFELVSYFYHTDGELLEVEKNRYVTYLSDHACTRMQSVTEVIENNV